MAAVTVKLTVFAPLSLTAVLGCFGFKLFHRRSVACELDVLVLAAASAPYMHGETRLWPPWGTLLATPYHALASAWHRISAAPGSDGGGPHFVLAEDVARKQLMADKHEDKQLSTGRRAPRALSQVALHAWGV